MLDELLGRARAGTGGALVLRGEAGIGKTVLLDDVVARARLPGRADGGHAIGDGTPLRGIAAALQPLLDRLERLPAPQGEAISLAFGLTGGPAPDRFLVGLGVLSLLSVTAAEPVVLCRQ